MERLCSYRLYSFSVITGISHKNLEETVITRERLDRFNGLLLTPNLDSAFDNGMISFDDEGTILISRKLSNESKIKLGINEKMNIRKVEKQHIKYLDYHRKKVFLK